MVVGSVPFVLGFTAFFVLLGVGAALVGGRLFADQFLLERIAGFVLVVFGLAFMGLLPWPERLLGAGLVQEAREPRLARAPGRRIRGLRGTVHRSGARRDPRARRLVGHGRSRAGRSSASTRSGWPCRSSSQAPCSRGRWALSAGSATTTATIQIVGGAIMVALGLLLFFERFYVLRVYLNRFLEWLGLEPAF